MIAVSTFVYMLGMVGFFVVLAGTAALALSLLGDGLNLEGGIALLAALAILAGGLWWVSERFEDSARRARDCIEQGGEPVYAGRYGTFRHCRIYVVTTTPPKGDG